MSLTASCFQGTHKNLWETQGLPGALGSPLPTGQSTMGGCRPHGRPLNTAQEHGPARHERGPSGGDGARRMGKGEMHIGQQQIQGGEADTSQLNTEANLISINDQGVDH